MENSSRTEVVSMCALTGGFLGLLLLAGPSLGRCGVDPECIFNLGGVAIRGSVIGLVAGLVAGLLLMPLFKKENHRS